MLSEEHREHWANQVRTAGQYKARDLGLAIMVDVDIILAVDRLLTEQAERIGDLEAEVERLGADRRLLAAEVERQHESINRKADSWLVITDQLAGGCECALCSALRRAVAEERAALGERQGS